VGLIERLVIPASLHEPDGRFVFMNSAAERACGYTNGELRGRRFTALLPLPVRPVVEGHFRRAAERGEPTDFQTVFRDGAGVLRGVRAQHLPLRDGENEIVGVLILAFDVREAPVEPSHATNRPRLTPRQQEVLTLIAAGRTTAEVAGTLTLSRETVRNHLRGVFKELNAHTRPEAIATARRYGLLAPPPLRPSLDTGDRD